MCRGGIHDGPLSQFDAIGTNAISRHFVHGSDTATPFHILILLLPVLPQYPGEQASTGSAGTST